MMSSANGMERLTERMAGIMAVSRTSKVGSVSQAWTANDGSPAAVGAAVIRRRRPDVDPADLVAADWPQLHRQLDAYIAAGLSKFVIRPAGGGDLDAFLDRFADELLPRQN